MILRLDIYLIFLINGVYIIYSLTLTIYVNIILYKIILSLNMRKHITNYNISHNYKFMIMLDVTRNK